MDLGDANNGRNDSMAFYSGNLYVGTENWTTSTARDFTQRNSYSSCLNGRLRRALIEFSHPSYFEALKYLISKDGSFRRKYREMFRRNRFSNSLKRMEVIGSDVAFIRFGIIQLFANSYLPIHEDTACPR
jgi:hypothetical protein